VKRFEKVPKRRKEAGGVGKGDSVRFQVACVALTTRDLKNSLPIGLLEGGVINHKNHRKCEKGQSKRSGNSAILTAFVYPFVLPKEGGIFWGR